MRRKWTAVICVCMLSLGSVFGCGSGTDQSEGMEQSGVDDTKDSDGSEENSDTGKAFFSQTDADMFTDRDYRTAYDESECVLIELDGDTITSSSDRVQINGTTATVKEEAVYIISGTLEDGMMIVDAPDTAKLQSVFNGAHIHSETSAPLYILEADKVFVTLAENTENSLSNGGEFTAADEENIDAALYSKQDLTLNGSGSLTVTSPAGHGIVSNDDLVITGGTYQIASASHGLKANDSIRITGDTSVTADTGKDGIHAQNDSDTDLGFVYISDGTMEIEAEGDGVSAGAYMHVVDGTFQITSGGGSVNGSHESSDSWGGFRGEMPPGQHAEETENTADDSSTSMKGLKSERDMLISEGSFNVDSADDSIHSNTSITVNGGTFQLASGDDAVHADESLTVTECTMNITESYEGLEALDIAIQGGDIKLVSSDDGLNAAGGTDSSGTEGGRDGMFGGGEGGPGGGMSSASNGSITISGGTIQITASGDGIDANGSLEISGGYTVVTGPTQGDTATMDYDTTAVITGGTFIGTGAAGMAQTFSSSEQGVISASAGEQSAGTVITLLDQDGSALLTFTPELSFNVIILSSPDLVSGETYTLTAGNLSGELEAD